MEFETHVVRGRPLPKEPLSFFQYNQGSRFFVDITDSPSVWQEDLIIGERFFADTIICPLVVDDTMASHQTAYELTKDVLKQRMKYPGVKENPALEQIARTWILPTKVTLGPNATTFLEQSQTCVTDSLKQVFEQLDNTESRIHLLKIEVPTGIERQLVYKFLDNGFRPSMILVKWSHDLDDHIPTAHCAGHLMNTGYALASLENGYGLYVFTDQVLYDITSMKTLGLKNPMMESILQSVSETMQVESVTTTTATTE